MTEVLLAEGVTRTLRTAGSGAGSRFSLTIGRFALAPGGRVAVVGPSGSGKSTLLALLALALRPGGGVALRLCGTDAMALWRGGALDALAGLRARTLGFVPQTGALLPFLTLGENIALPQRLVGRPEPARVAAVAERLGIGALLSRRPAQVSVGQRQRAAIARALAHRPALVFADEPTASVHPAQADAVLALLAGAAAEGAAVAIATHDAARAAAAGFALVECRADGAEGTRVG